MTDDRSLPRWELRVALASVGDHDDGGGFSLAVARLNKKSIRIAMQKGRDIAGLAVDAFLQKEEQAWDVLKKRAMDGEVVLFGVAYWPKLPGQIANKDDDEEEEVEESESSEDADAAADIGVEETAGMGKPTKIRIFDHDADEDEAELIGLDDLTSLVLDHAQDTLKLRPRDWMHSDAPWWRDIEVEFRQSLPEPADTETFHTARKRYELAQVIRKVFPNGPPKGCGTSGVMERARDINLAATDFALLQKASEKTFRRAIEQSKSKKIRNWSADRS
jgi:hypothetical protein